MGSIEIPKSKGYLDRALRLRLCTPLSAKKINKLLPSVGI
jgi:hypothetical protein